MPESTTGPFPAGTSPTRIALFAGYFADDAEGLSRHVRESNPTLDERQLYAASVRRWEEYRADVERRLTEGAAGGATPSVFGVCRRCGGRRV